MFIYKQLDQLLFEQLVAQGYKYLWFDGYMNYAPTATGERLDIRRIVPLREITQELEEAMELAKMLHESHPGVDHDLLTGALTQDELYPIEYFRDKLDPQARNLNPVADASIVFDDECDWYVEVEA